MFVWCYIRFNCGTGAAQITSESRVALGRWHTVTIFRDGLNGWLRMDNDTPVSGRSPVRAIPNIYMVMWKPLYR